MAPTMDGAQSYLTDQSSADFSGELTLAPSDAGPVGVGPVDTDTADAEQAADAASEEAVAAAAVVPQPAPRDGMENPLLMEGAVLAFASEESSDGSAAPGSVDDASAKPAVDASPTGAAQPGAMQGGVTRAGVMQAEPTTDTDVPAADQSPKSLFAVLFQRGQPEPAKPATRVASLGAIPSSSHGTQHDGEARAGETGLPGVKSSQELFGLSDEAHEEAEGAYEVAAVGGLGRLSPNGLRLQTDRVEVGCLDPGLIAILNRVERHFGRKPVITSGYRSPSDNRRAGGARKSLHMQCKAADIQVEGVSKFDLAKFLQTVPGRGGVGTYCRTRSVHIDTGKEREWHYPCRRVKKRKS